MYEKITYIFVYFFLANNQTFAYYDVIENNFKQCLKKSNGSYDMAVCTEEASNKTEAEISKLLKQYPNLNESIKINQELWEEYKKNVKLAVNKPLHEALGWDYLLFANENIYRINKDRLHILEHLLKNSEYPISSKLTQINIAEYLNALKGVMKQDKYITLINNQKDWKKYKTNLEELLIDSKYKANVIQDLNGERNSQLSSLYHLFTANIENNK